MIQGGVGNSTVHMQIFSANGSYYFAGGGGGEGNLATFIATVVTKSPMFCIIFYQAWSKNRIFLTKLVNKRLFLVNALKIRLITTPR